MATGVECHAFIKRYIWTLIVFITFLFALLLRLYFSVFTIHGDLMSQAGWGWWLYHHGIRNFYDNNQWIYGWPSHPPLITAMYGASFLLHDLLNRIFVGVGLFIASHHLGAGHITWWYTFTTWFGTSFVPQTPFKFGEIISLKLTPIIADLVLAGMVYKFVRLGFSARKSLLFAAIYLFSPFSWYLSSLWGQTDQLGFITLIASFLLLFTRFTILAPIVFSISAGLKPTSLIFTPFFLWLSFRQQNKIRPLLLGCGASLMLYFGIVRIYSDRNFFLFNYFLSKQLFVKGEFWTWVNTFNFWRLITGYLMPYKTSFLLLPLKIWGYILFAVCNIVSAAVVSKKQTLIEVLIALFIISFSGWHFLVTMHDRYEFTALIVGLILAAYYPKLLKYWVVMSLIYLVNLYNGWRYPHNIEFLHRILDWEDGSVPRFLSLVNMYLFFAMTFTLVPPKKLMKIVKDFALKYFNHLRKSAYYRRIKPTFAAHKA